jgi:hypothetical protein
MTPLAIKAGLSCSLLEVSRPPSILANKESDGLLCGAGYRDSLHSHACLSMLASSPTQSRVTKALLQTSMLVRQRYQSLRTPPKVPGFCPPDGVQVPLAFSTASL